MSDRRSRRKFVAEASMMALGAAGLGGCKDAKQNAPTPGQPPAFGTAPAVGPEVSAATFAEAEKLVRVEMTERDLAQAASKWRQAMAPLYERRTGPRRVTLESDLAPWSRV